MREAALGDDLVYSFYWCDSRESCLIFIIISIIIIIAALDLFRSERRFMDMSRWHLCADQINTFVFVILNN